MQQQLLGIVCCTLQQEADEKHSKEPTVLPYLISAVLTSYASLLKPSPCCATHKRLRDKAGEFHMASMKATASELYPPPL